MPKLPIKKTRTLAKVKKEGELKAITENKAKIFTNKKQLQNWLVARFESLVKDIDALELMAIFGTTVLIKQGIDWAQIAVNEETVNLFHSILTADWLQSFRDIIALQEPEEPKAEPIGATLTEWVISFVVAFILIRHADAVINAGGNILFMAKGLIGALG